MSVKAISKLAEIRKQSGLTQAQLAVLVGVTTNTIQNWEKKEGLTQLEKYLKLGEIFGLKSLKDLFEYVEISEDKDDQRSKGFSIEELRQIRQNWGTDVTADDKPDKKIEAPPKSKSSRKI